MVDFDDTLFFAPITGEIVDLTECIDPIFSQGIVGAGVLCLPTDSKVYAPCAGKVTIVTNGNHGIAIKNASGYQILIHIGIDTVEMNGDGFKSFKKVGDEVKPGDLLLEFDPIKMKEAGKSTQSPIIITNPAIKKVDIIADGSVKSGEEIFRILNN